MTGGCRHCEAQSDEAIQAVSKGNTHMMMDRNSDDIARLVGDWSDKQGLSN
ncbi:hypothetical protein ACKWRH_18595 [Bradyrhizobium sp. Pa8]|uniref:hypothetical protein n=1 Tax=Bradyrhizobium sp. Pa8 TaxID=3386552 RepID=UPI00403F9BF7